MRLAFDHALTFVQNKTSNHDWTDQDEKEFRAMLARELDKVHEFQKEKVLQQRSFTVRGINDSHRLRSSPTVFVMQKNRSKRSSKRTILARQQRIIQSMFRRCTLVNSLNRRLLPETSNLKRVW